MGVHGAPHPSGGKGDRIRGVVPPPLWLEPKPGWRIRARGRLVRFLHLVGACSVGRAGLGLASRKVSHRTPTRQLELPLLDSLLIGPRTRVSHPQMGSHWLLPRFCHFRQLHWLEGRLRSGLVIYRD